MSIKEKTIANLIDELITNNMRCWFAQDKLMDMSLSEKERLNAAIVAQQTNAKRTELIKAIDELLGFGQYTNVTKTYIKDESK
jgi:hypothetical protein